MLRLPACYLSLRLAHRNNVRGRYAQLAAHAQDIGRNSLAAALLEKETCAAEQVCTSAASGHDACSEWAGRLCLRGGVLLRPSCASLVLLPLHCLIHVGLHRMSIVTASKSSESSEALC